MYQYIPIAVTPNGRRWEGGEKVTFRIGHRTWLITVVLSTGLPRFSAGWNKFVADNELKVNDNLIFTLVQEERQLIFDIRT